MRPKRLRRLTKLTKLHYTRPLPNGVKAIAIAREETLPWSLEPPASCAETSRDAAFLSRHSWRRLSVA